MIIFILVICGFNTVKSIMPLTEKKNWDVISFLYAVVQVVVYVFLLKHFLEH